MTSPLPDFLIIGAQKSATRWLRENLGLHPEIHTVDRELEFFNHRFLEGAEWYRAQFDGGRGEAHRGESTPGYMFVAEDTELIAARIQLTLGSDVGLLAMLRDPVERARSAYVHHMRNRRIDPDLDPGVYLTALEPEGDDLGILTGGWYGRALRPYARRFGERLHVEFHDDVVTDPAAVYGRAVAHIGASHWLPDRIGEPRHAGAEQVNRRLLDHPVFTMPESELREILSRWFVEDADTLGELLGRPVPWATTS